MHKKIGSPQAQGVIELLRQGGKLVKMHKRAIVRGDSFVSGVSEKLNSESVLTTLDESISTTQAHLPMPLAVLKDSTRDKSIEKSSKGFRVAANSTLPSFIRRVTEREVNRLPVNLSKLSKCNKALALSQSLNIFRASSDEMRFMEFYLSFGWKTATYLATKFHWKCQRPLQALRAMMNERGKNYSGKSAKRKRPSGSPASLKKRS